MSTSPRIREVLKEIVKDKVLKFLLRYCRCVEAEHKYGDILKLRDKLDEIQRRAIEKKELVLEDAGLRILVNRRFLSKTVCVEYRGVQYCGDNANVFLSRIRTLVEWYVSDCNLDNIIFETIENDDFNLINFVRKNLDNLRKLCLGEDALLDMSMLEDFAREGVDIAIKEFKLRK